MINKFYLDTNEIKNGDIIQLPNFCKKKLRKKCLEHYTSHDENKWEICPYGFSTYKAHTHNFIFTGMVELKNIDNKILKEKIKSNQNLIKLEKDDLNKIVSNEIENIELRDSDFFLQSLIHEFRKLNNIILATTEYLIYNSLDLSLEEKTKRFLNIQGASHFFTSRLRSYDYWKNKTLFSEKVSNFYIYKKFEKASQILELISNSKIRKFSGESFSKFSATESFELLPFILLENAIKYSPADKSIDVEFKENQNDIKVTIQNIGPFLNEDEINKICKRGFRGKVVSDIKAFEGYGLGLFIANEICTENNISINFISDKSRKFRRLGIDYSYFIVTLIFPIKKDL